ncbi:proprotein convertase subtilisin/kexin type 4-like [Mercenaria mercenaria]|uniref:proprotein convertase subtilisin/kexin type 4-like n=1 Tax=Mercenaria mercenaria TaxID=6596 RepID=UPI00234EC0C1|nr:proprotein convertase subtilisin/kexin type 4-like [Mercenaria mercenaria]
MRGKFISGYLTDNKHMPVWIILLIFIVILNSCLALAENDFERLNRAVITVNTTNKQALFTLLQKYDFSLLHEITPSTYIFEYISYQGNKTLQEACQTVLDVFLNEIIDAEPVRMYQNALQPWDPGKGTNIDAFENVHLSNINIEHNYGMDISKVWSRGHSGKGVTFAVTGVGIEEQLLDLRKNTNPNLSFNFVSDKSDVTPEVFKRSQKKALLFTDHGNRVAGILAAERGNGICSAGISYDSSVVGIKMFAVRMVAQPPHTPILRHLTASDIVSKALTHRLDDIDIYVNAWTPSAPFDSLDLATREAIAHGAKMGRHGLGAVYIVPAGPTGNLLSNNIHTIAVGMFGVNGTVHSGSVKDASVLTSGLGDGNSLTSSSVITTSHYNKCISSFKGYSAAVAQVAGIIGLGLEANPSLSVRDIQHLLVKASGTRGIKVAATFKRNGAGLYFHEMFGFGLLNADKFVSLSEKNTPVSSLIETKLQPYEPKVVNAFTRTVKFCSSCDILRGQHCLTTIEHVSVLVEIGTPTDDIFMELISPSGTRSVVMDFQKSQGTSTTYKEAKLVSVSFWDEIPFGIWILTVESKLSGSDIRLNTSSLILYGTHNRSITNTGHGSVKTLCKSDKSAENIRTAAVKTTPLESSPTKTANTVEEHKTNIAVIVILPVGIVIMCGILVFIFMRGGTHGPVSSFGKPAKKKTKKPDPVSPRRVNDTRLHRQVSLLREKSRSESASEDLTEDIEGEEEELNKT